MRPRCLLVAALLAGTVCGLGAQTRTADGVVALARGDDQRATDILKPLAEDWRTDDPVAAFFMAGLYDAGRGVPADPLRACALYMRAAFKDQTALGREAMRLMRTAALSNGPEFNQECQLLSNIGLDNGFEPVTFDLGPGHFVEWTLAAGTVTYEGRRHRVPMGYFDRGARFLPLQHTELVMGPAGSEPRHFVQMFAWQPAGRSAQQWHLICQLFEIVRDQIIHLEILGPLADADGDAPPSRDAFNARDYVDVRVNPQGRTEWAVLTGLHPRTQVIASEAERQAVRDRSVARDRALKAVDWTKRLDVRRRPTLAYVDADGCGNLEVYGWSSDRAEVLVVRRGGGDGLVSQPAIVDLARGSAGLSIDVFVYAAPQQRFAFCTDVGNPPDPDVPAPETWHAVAGTLTIEVSPPGGRAQTPDLRQATVTGSNLVLKNAAGATLSVPGPVRLTAFVGSVGGE